MLFSESERKELAAFFAKRFQDPTIRHMLAKRAGVSATARGQGDPQQDWEALIGAAQQKRRLDKLASLAAKTDQTDPNLQAVCNLLGARARTVRHRAIAGSIAATLALSFGVGGWWLGNGVETTTTLASADEPIVELAMANTVVPGPVSEVATSLAEPTVGTNNATKTAPTTSAPEPREIETPDTTRTENKKNNGPAYRKGRCTYDNVGDFIGYWYAGRNAPGATGEVIDVEMGVNVRSKYPHGGNGFNKRAPVRCILKRGDKVKLTAAPILVPGDHYWVPLHHGDIVQEAPEEMLVATR